MKHKWVALVTMQPEIYHQNSQSFYPSEPFTLDLIIMRHPVIHFLGNPCGLYSVFCLCNMIKVLQKSVPESSVYGAKTGLKKYIFFNIINLQCAAVQNEKLFLQRYGEQSVRWLLCAPYRCKYKCLWEICFYSDMEHKSMQWQLCSPYRCKHKCLWGICFYSDIEHKSNNIIKMSK